MVTPALLNPEVRDFIFNFSGDISALAFKGSPFPEIPVRDLLEQIDSRNRIQKKLPLWFGTKGIIYPPKLNLEQTSSEITAAYKASLISGKTIADITGGFGVDCLYFSEKFEKVYHFEQNSELSEIASHNFKVLKIPNIICTNTNGLKAVRNHFYDVIYADPSRRDDAKRKVFYLEDCEPDIPKNLEILLSSCKQLLVKTSPMLDISIGIQELVYVKEIHVVAIHNEVKELLWIIDKNPTANIQIKTINFDSKEAQGFDFIWNHSATASYSLPQNYLYEPNAAILKSGAFDLVSERFNIPKLHPNTHLYTGENLIEFPGRCFKIVGQIPYRKSEMRKANFKKANISTRNFPESVADLRKKWKIGSGGSIYLFFITNAKGKKEVLVCKKAG